MPAYKPIGLQFDAALKGALGEIQDRIADIARREHGKVMATDPKPSGFRQYVDGVAGAPFDAVRPDGVIFIEYQRLELVTDFALQTLIDLSPVGLPTDRRPGHPGLYRDSHTLFINDAQVSDLKSWKPGDEIAIANFLPYSRKIEIGKMTMRVPGTDHVYQQAEILVRRRFGNMADIRFTYRGIVGGSVIRGQSGGKSDFRYPALVIAESHSRYIPR